MDFLFPVLTGTEFSLKAGGYVQGAERRQGDTEMVAWGVTGSSASFLQARNSKSYNKFHKVRVKRAWPGCVLREKRRPLFSG